MVKIHALVLFFLTTPSLFSFSPGSDGRRNIDVDVRFVPLELDEEVYEGTIYDEKNKFTVTNISFAGITKILGIKNDEDDSSSILRISNIKKLQVVDPHYRSPRHTTNENSMMFIKAHVVHNTPSQVSGTMLIPYDIVLCAEDLATGTEKAWRLRDITSLEINHSPVGPDINRPTERVVRTRPLASSQRVSQQGIVGKVWEATWDGVYHAVKSLKEWLSKES